MTEITIAAPIGHSAATVTGRYIHHVDNALVAAADRVSARITAAMECREDSANPATKEWRLTQFSCASADRGA
jgi:hypothetical protein